MNITQKINLLFVGLFLSSLTVFGQTKKLVKNFKLGNISYGLYTLNKPTRGLNDTTFYQIHRIGIAKILAKEIKEVKVKSSAKVLSLTSFEILPNAVIFNLDDKNRKYTQTSNGLLKVEENANSSKIVRQMPAPLSTVKPTASSQNPEHGEVDVQAEFPGGMNAARSFIGRNLEYPAEAVENDVKGTVYAEFLIAKDGAVTNIKILKGIGWGCDEEVVRVIRKMPKWKPAQLNGANVVSRMRMPVSFMQNNE